MSRNDIDLDQLIDEVKRRPTLYSVSRNNHRIGYVERQTCWAEVAQACFPGNWRDASHLEQERLKKEVQTRWRTVRDTYQRMKRKRRLHGTKYGRLSFLDEFYAAHKSKEEVEIFIPETGVDSNEDSKYHLNFVSIGSDMLEDEAKNHREETTLASGSRHFQYDLNKTDDTRMHSLLQQLIKMQEDAQNDDPMGNKKFLLSLLPFMEKLNQEKNLEVRLQLMSILQLYSAKQVSND